MLCMFLKIPLDLGGENRSPVLDGRVLPDLRQKAEDRVVWQDLCHLGVEPAALTILAGCQDLPYQVSDLSRMFPIRLLHFMVSQKRKNNAL